MDREAHSFLCVSPDAVLTHRVRAIAGFRWGFTITRQAISISRPEALEPQAGDSHLDLLRTLSDVGLRCRVPRCVTTAPTVPAYRRCAPIPTPNADPGTSRRIGERRKARGHIGCQDHINWPPIYTAFTQPVRWIEA